MKKLMLVAIVALPVLSFAKFSGGDGHTVDFSKYKRMMVSVKKQVKEVRSDYSLPGYVIHYYSDGSVETNAIVHIDLKIQTNTVERQVAELDAEAEPARKVKKAKKNAEKKDQKNLEKAIKDIEKARDKSSEAIYDLYQSILDLLNGAD